MVCVPILAFNRFKGELIEISDIIKYCPSYMQKDFMSIMLKITQNQKRSSTLENVENDIDDEN